MIPWCCSEKVDFDIDSCGGEGRVHRSWTPMIHQPSAITQLQDASHESAIVQREQLEDIVSLKQTLILKMELTRWHNLEIACRGVSQYSYQVLLQYALEVTCLFRAHRRWMSSTYTILWSQANCPIRGLLRSVLNGHIGDCDYIVLFDGLWEEEKCLEISAKACATRTAGLIMMWIGVWPSCSRVSDVHRS